MDAQVDRISRSTAIGTVVLTMLHSAAVLGKSNNISNEAFRGVVKKAFGVHLRLFRAKFGYPSLLDTSQVPTVSEIVHQSSELCSSFSISHLGTVQVGNNNQMLPKICGDRTKSTLTDPQRRPVVLVAMRELKCFVLTATPQQAPSGPLAAFGNGDLDTRFACFEFKPSMDGEVTAVSDPVLTRVDIGDVNTKCEAFMQVKNRPSEYSLFRFVVDSSWTPTESLIGYFRKTLAELEVKYNSIVEHGNVQFSLNQVLLPFAPSWLRTGDEYLMSQSVVWKQQWKRMGYGIRYSDDDAQFVVGQPDCFEFSQEPLLPAVRAQPSAYPQNSSNSSMAPQSQPLPTDTRDRYAIVSSGIDPVIPVQGVLRNPGVDNPPATNRPHVSPEQKSDTPIENLSNNSDHYPVSNEQFKRIDVPPRYGADRPSPSGGVVPIVGANVQGTFTESNGSFQTHARDSLKSDKRNSVEQWVQNIPSTVESHPQLIPDIQQRSPASLQQQMFPPQNQYHNQYPNSQGYPPTNPPQYNPGSHQNFENPQPQNDHWDPQQVSGAQALPPIRPAFGLQAHGNYPPSINNGPQPQVSSPIDSTYKRTNSQRLSNPNPPNESAVPSPQVQQFSNQHFLNSQQLQNSGNQSFYAAGNDSHPLHSTAVNHNYNADQADSLPSPAQSAPRFDSARTTNSSHPASDSNITDGFSRLSVRPSEPSTGNGSMLNNFSPFSNPAINGQSYFNAFSLASNPNVTSTGTNNQPKASGMDMKQAIFGRKL